GGGRYGAVFVANRAVLLCPVLLVGGFRLSIPCADGAATAAGPETAPVVTAAVAPAVVPARPAPAASAPGGTLARGGALRLLALDARAPLVGERLPEGGFLSEIVSRALLAAPMARDFEIDFAPRGERLDAVVEGDYDLGYPALRPDCEDAGLDAARRAVCERFVFSGPIGSSGLALFANRDGEFAGATSARDLAGARICHPTGLDTAVLDAAGLGEGRVSLIEAAPADCAAMLAYGDVGVVAFAEAAAARAAAEAAGVAGRIAPIGGVVGGRGLHVAVPRAHPDARALIALLDEGLAAMRASGTYAAIAANHLGARD
ncbi:MAG: substrate-binding periplasmic protein, partial [Paracoccaceae bacterium]